MKESESFNEVTPARGESQVLSDNALQLMKEGFAILERTVQRALEADTKGLPTLSLSDGPDIIDLGRTHEPPSNGRFRVGEHLSVRPDPGFELRAQGEADQSDGILGDVPSVPGFVLKYPGEPDVGGAKQNDGAKPGVAPEDKSSAPNNKDGGLLDGIEERRGVTTIPWFDQLPKKP